MSSSKGPHPLALLDSLADLWIQGRGSRIVAPVPPGERGDHEYEGPGLIYRWSQGFEPVAISLLSKRKQKVSSEDWSHLIFLKFDSPTLTLETSRGPLQTFHLEDTAARRRIDNTLGELQSATQAHDALSLIALAQRMVALTRTLQHTEPVSTRDRFVSDLHEWFADRIDSSIKLGDAAEAFGKSPRQLIRILKEATGTGFSEHLAMRRLLLSREMLMRTADSVIQIATKAGFNGREQFIRSFKRHFGWTPLQFRKSWNRASLENSSLVELCSVCDRIEVIWDSSDCAPPTPGRSSAHTLTVANATHGVIELFRIDFEENHARSHVLERGAMVFIPQAVDGSHWLVRAPGQDYEKRFATPTDHALAIVSPIPDKKERPRAKPAASR